MRNLSLLFISSIGILLWGWDLASIPSEPEQKKHNIQELVDFSSVNQTQFDAESLAKIIGVDFSKIDKQQTESTPENFEIELSLISVYQSGDSNKIRVKVIKESEEHYQNLIVGDSIYSLKVQSINPRQVTLANTKESFLLKMFKPIVINVEQQIDSTKALDIKDSGDA